MRAWVLMQGGNMEHRKWWSIVLGDVHFWVPVVVLAGGLLVLRWIS